MQQLHTKHHELLNIHAKIKYISLIHTHPCKNHIEIPEICAQCAEYQRYSAEYLRYSAEYPHKKGKLWWAIRPKSANNTIGYSRTMRNLRLATVRSMYVYVCVYILYTYTRTYIDTHLFVYTYSHSHTCTYIYIHITTRCTKSIKMLYHIECILNSRGREGESNR